jgi:hypothetical protein
VNCVVLQPSYIPWRGYFHQIRKADVFVFYDDVQYDKHGWRNRNCVKSQKGAQWLTIPVRSGGCVTEGTPIHDIRIDWNRRWNTDHWKTLTQLYGKASFFHRYAGDLERFYQSRPERLVDLTIPLTEYLAGALGISHVRFLKSSDFRLHGNKNDRLLDLLNQVGATHYISGPSARSYLDADRFARAGITIEFMKYDYPEYPQRFPPFISQVSILDLLFMAGDEAPGYIWNVSGGIA